jgi:hypothetical protein
VRLDLTKHNRNTRAPIVEDPVQLTARIEALLAKMRDLNLRSDESSLPEAEALLASLPSLLRNLDNFVAGSCISCHAAWSALLSKSKRRSAKNVLSWLRHGVKPEFVGAAAAKPLKVNQVVGMLRRQVPASDIPHMLLGNEPHRVSFDNHKSFYDNWEFGSGEVNKLVLWSAASRILDGEEMPWVIHPLGVATTGGKQRLILNSRYANLFMKALPFHYERLRDILGFTMAFSFMSNWDLKSGYYHVLIHPKYRKYFGCKVGDQGFQFNVVFFGYAQACYICTKIMQEPCFELWSTSIPVSGYVDDGFTSAADRLACLWQSLFAVLLQAALGGFHGLAKCQIDPVQEVKWLVFMIDSVKERFVVGTSKLDKLKQFLTSILIKPSVSARDLAQVAGKIISRSPAVDPAALYSRTFFEAIKGSATWDAVFPNPSQVKSTLQFWLDNIDDFNGRPWWPKQVSLRAEVDASGVGFGGILFVPSQPPRRLGNVR